MLLAAPSFTVSRRALALLLGVALLAGVAPQMARAQDLIQPKTINRKFPQGQFCALPIEIAFVATAATCVVRFEAQNYILDGSNALQWTAQAIDNVALSGAAQYDANYGPPLESQQSFFCYIRDFDTEPPVSFFYSNRAGLVLPLFDRFDTDPTARGWDMTHGGYFNPTHTAVRDVEHYENNPTGGCMGLGLESGAPSLSDIATTEVTVSGLTSGQTYKISAWWDVNFVEFTSNATYLTVRVLGEGSTEITKRSWGAVKRAYR